jgi:cytochrome c-type biogenesis protein CcmH/NrfG
MVIPWKTLVALGCISVVGCATTPPSGTGNTRIDLDSHVLLAELAREREEFTSAAEHYLAAAMISDEPRLAGLATEMAHELDLDETGLAAARRWRELEPDNFRSTQFLGLFLLRTGDIEAAVSVYEELLATARVESAGLALIVEGLF